MNPLIPKARRPKFYLSLRIYDLNNVPLVSGTSYVKWHLPTSNAAEHRGRTEKSSIKDHKVSWDYMRSIPIRLTIGKFNNLQECLINFEVVQDYSSGSRSEKITLGSVSLNLAEYVEETETIDVEEGVVRRYLMQESKINSTLKIGLAMKQVDGERNFIAPPLKSAPVFGGIAGIIPGEQAEQDEISSLLTVGKLRDHNDLQDMYRHALAASWAAQLGELPVDQCIEDIFAGGDGWKEKCNPTLFAPLTKVNSRSHSVGEDDSSQQSNLQAPKNYTESSKSHGIVKDGKRRGHRNGSKDADMEDSTRLSESSPEQSERGRGRNKRHAHEANEFDIREDLVAWRSPRETAATS